MITRKLSKAQGFVIQGLGAQLGQLQVQANEIQAAMNEQADLLRAKYKLPEGEAQFSQAADGWSIVVTPKPEPAAEVPVPVIDDAPELARESYEPARESYEPS